MSEDAVYAIADTHFGLRSSIVQTHSDEPAYVGDFIRWLETLPENNRIRVLEGDEIRTRDLRPGSHLVLLGDMLELWDAENRNILLSSVPVATVLDRVEAKKTYVLGNHDYPLVSTTGSYPIGASGLEVVKEIFPKPDEENGTVTPMRIGDQSYVFVHGHQFDWLFRATGRLWHMLGILRQFGAALGTFAWLIFALWLAMVLAQLVVGSPLWAWLLALTLASLWIPRLCMRIAQIGRLAFGKRYERKKALEGFRSWWSDYHLNVEERDKLGIVYGHTHILDWLEVRPEQVDRPDLSEEERKMAAFMRSIGKGHHTLYNISSWVSTRKKKYEKHVNATIFYADEDGPLLLGWNWKNRSPFHIPFEFVRKRLLEQPLIDTELALVEELQWPSELIEKWKAV